MQTRVNNMKFVWILQVRSYTIKQYYVAKDSEKVSSWTFGINTNHAIIIMRILLI